MGLRPSLIVLVTGGRDFNDALLVSQILSGFEIGLLIEGGATGADSVCANWAYFRGIPVRTVRADWDTHGKSAGPVRNQRMVDMKPDQVIAFPGGRGTADCVRRAQEAGIPTLIVGCK